MRTPQDVVRSRAVIVGPALVGVTLALGGCSSSPATPTSAASSGAATSAVAAVPVTASIATVAGRLAPPARRRLQQRVSVSVGQWIDHAYLGSYPRTDFDDAYDTFTPTAARRAAAQRSLTSNAAEASTLTSVTPVRRVLRLDVLAVKGVAVGVTARVHLALATRGSAGPGRERVDGEVYLSYSRGDGWRIFGYDLTRGAA